MNTNSLPKYNFDLGTLDFVPAAASKLLACQAKAKGRLLLASNTSGSQRPMFFWRQLKFVLEKSGFEVDFASDSFKVFYQLNRNSYSMVIFDSDSFKSEMTAPLYSLQEFWLDCDNFSPDRPLKVLEIHNHVQASMKKLLYFSQPKFTLSMSQPFYLTVQKVVDEIKRPDSSLPRGSKNKNEVQVSSEF